MTLRSPELRAAAELLKAHRRESKPPRVKPPAPKHKNADTRVKDNVFLAWTRRQPCAVGPVGCSGRIDPAHVRSHRPGGRPTGMGRKPDDLGNVNPLCRAHHEAQHADANEMRWWASFGKHPHISAEIHATRYLDEVAEGQDAAADDASRCGFERRRTPA